MAAAYAAAVGEGEGEGRGEDSPSQGHAPPGAPRPCVCPPTALRAARRPSAAHPNLTRAWPRALGPRRPKAPNVGPLHHPFRPRSPTRSRIPTWVPCSAPRARGPPPAPRHHTAPQARRSRPGSATPSRAPYAPGSLPTPVPSTLCASTAHVPRGHRMPSGPRFPPSERLRLGRHDGVAVEAERGLIKAISPLTVGRDTLINNSLEGV